MFSPLIAAAVLAASVPMAIAGPKGRIAGTFVDGGRGAPVVVIIPGSGPTDRDGDNPMGVTAAPYRLLAEALAAQGISTLRADKRGMFASQAAIADPNAVTLRDYAHDAHEWARALRQRTATKCVWLLGHSEGGVIALVAAQNPQDICGLILLASPGRKLGVILRQQLQANPANAPVLPQALAALEALEAGKLVDTSKMNPALLPLFNAKIQPFLMDLLRADAASLAANTTLPMLIIRGGKDIQVAAADAEALHTARPDATLVSPPMMNHVLKDVRGDDRASNIATYADPSLAVDAGLVEAIVGFVKK